MSEDETMSDEAIELPWRVTGLDGYRSDSGPTYNGGQWSGGGERSDKHLAVRTWKPMGRPATVSLDLGDKSHGCTITLTPAVARAAAQALLAGAAEAEAEMRKWREMLDKQRAEILAAQQRDLLGRAGVTDA